MRIRLNPRWLLVSALLFSLQLCRAQITVPPTLSFDLGSDDPADNKLWDITGSYVVNLNVVSRNGNSVPVQIDFFLLQGPTGKLTTSVGNITGLVFNDDNNSQFAITTKISGKVTGSSGVGRVHFTVNFSGNGPFGGVPNTTVQGSMNVDAETDASTGQLVGTKVTHFTANIIGVNKIQGTADFVSALPAGVDGTWNLTMNLAGLDKFTGNGIVGLPGQSFGMDLTGKFNGLLSLKATGASDVPDTLSGKGSNAKIFVTPSFNTVQVEGKLLGQKISLNVTEAAPDAQK
jgi:hypothetical protein